MLLTAIAREAQTLANTGGIQSVVLSKPVQLQELLSCIEGQLHASMTFNQLQDSASHAFHSQGPASHLPAHEELPDFDEETPWASDAFAPARPAITPPSSPLFDGAFPLREQTPAAPSNAFLFPGRNEEGSLPG